MWIEYTSFPPLNIFFFKTFVYEYSVLLSSGGNLHDGRYMDCYNPRQLVARWWVKLAYTVLESNQATATNWRPLTDMSLNDVLH